MSSSHRESSPGKPDSNFQRVAFWKQKLKPEFLKETNTFLNKSKLVGFGAIRTWRVGLLFNWLHKPYTTTATVRIINIVIGDVVHVWSTLAHARGVVVAMAAHGIRVRRSEARISAVAWWDVGGMRDRGALRCRRVLGQCSESKVRLVRIIGSIKLEYYRPLTKKNAYQNRFIAIRLWLSDFYLPFRWKKTSIFKSNQLPKRRHTFQI